MYGLRAPARLLTVAAVGATMSFVGAPRRQPASIAIDYPAERSIFPPEITPPTFLWCDPAGGVFAWKIDVTFGDGSATIHAGSKGEGIRIGPIDPRGRSNKPPPALTPEQAESHTWTPDSGTWSEMKKHSVERLATITITGLSGHDSNEAVSRGRVTVETSKDSVGAPIFYRDVPLMPSEVAKGVIKPLAPAAIPLIAWRLRYVGEPESTAFHRTAGGWHSPRRAARRTPSCT